MARPMGPPPRTKTIESRVKGAAEIACHATLKGSTRAPTSRGTLSGRFKTAASGTTTDSLRPPPPPERPTKPPLKQTFSAPALHASHTPQYILGWIQTFSPTEKVESGDPTSVIVPENSWPSVMGIFSLVHG